MKSIKVNIILFLFSITVFGQQGENEFSLSPAGFEDSVVREYPGKSGSELYLSARLWAAESIDNAESAISKDVRNRYLEYQVFVPAAFSITNEGRTYTWDAMFDLAFKFENNKIKYDIEIVEVSSEDAPVFALKGGPKQWAFYNLNNEPYDLTSDALKKMEEIVNDFIRGVSVVVNRDEEIPEKQN